MIGVLPGMYEYAVTNRATSGMVTDQMNIEFEGTLLHIGLSEINNTLVICSGYSAGTGNQNLVLKVPVHTYKCIQSSGPGLYVPQLGLEP